MISDLKLTASSKDIIDKLNEIIGYLNNKQAQKIKKCSLPECNNYSENKYCCSGHAARNRKRIQRQKSEDINKRVNEAVKRLKF